MLKRWQSSASHDIPAAQRHEYERLERRAARIRALERQRLPIAVDMQLAIAGDTLDNIPALAAAIKWLELARPARRPILILHGASGTGKSVAGAAALVRRQGARWCSPRDLLEAYPSQYGEAAARWHELEHAPLVILDDLGAELERSRFVMADALLHLLAHRPLAHTLITSRLTDRQLRQRYGSQPLEHLFDDAAYHVALGPLHKGTSAPPASSP